MRRYRGRWHRKTINRALPLGPMGRFQSEAGKEGQHHLAQGSALG